MVRYAVKGKCAIRIGQEKQEELLVFLQERDLHICYLLYKKKGNSQYGIHVKDTHRVLCKKEGVIQHGVSEKK
jgi:hypothetical protein